jgi:hypothetical protein
MSGVDTYREGGGGPAGQSIAVQIARAVCACTAPSATNAMKAATNVLLILASSITSPRRRIRTFRSRAG